jgi:hypothetical protein
MLQVIIHRDDEVAAYIMEAAEQGRMLSEVAGHLENLHARILFPEAFHDSPGIVPGTVIHEKQFKVPAEYIVEDIFQPAVKFFKSMLRIVYRYDDRVEGHSTRPFLVS